MSANPLNVGASIISNFWRPLVCLFVFDDLPSYTQVGRVLMGRSGEGQLAQPCMCELCRGEEQAAVPRQGVWYLLSLSFVCDHHLCAPSVRRTFLMEPRRQDTWGVYKGSTKCFHSSASAAAEQASFQEGWARIRITGKSDRAWVKARHLIS